MPTMMSLLRWGSVSAHTMADLNQRDRLRALVQSQALEVAL
jgi:hypothetical protein